MSLGELKYAVNSSIGTASFKPLDTKINEVQAVINNSNIIKYGSAVKSVQRGCVSGTTNTSEASRTVYFSAVNISKSSFYVVGIGSITTSSSTPNGCAAISSWSSTSLTISWRPTYSSYNLLYWEVVEFY